MLDNPSAQRFRFFVRVHHNALRPRKNARRSRTFVTFKHGNDVGMVMRKTHRNRNRRTENAGVDLHGIESATERATRFVNEPLHLTMRFPVDGKDTFEVRLRHDE
jgi:hypothetical protein